MKDDYIKSAKPGEATVQVRDHPHSEKHLLFVVTFRGRVYACASAWEPGTEPKPSVDSVSYFWRHNRHQFLPYNESTGTFI